MRVSRPTEVIIITIGIILGIFAIGFALRTLSAPSAALPSPMITSTSTPTPTPTPTVTPTDTPSPTPTVTLTPTFTPPLITPEIPTCPPAVAEGTVPPAVAIYSITLVVNGVEKVVNDANSLQAFSSGDQVRVKEVTICSVDPFEGSGGRVYVEFDPVDQNGQVILPEVKGTQAVSVPSGFTVIPGPDYTWAIGDNWRHISFVTVHYPGGGTQNPGCEEGTCEIDDRMIVGIQ